LWRKGEQFERKRIGKDRDILEALVIRKIKINKKLRDICMNVGKEWNQIDSFGTYLNNSCKI
jgi:hypothetical protein